MATTAACAATSRSRRSAGCSARAATRPSDDGARGHGAGGPERAGDPELRARRRLHPQQRQVLRAVVHRQLQRALPAARRRAHQDDGDRDRDRLLHRVRRGADRAPPPQVRAAVRERRVALLHDPLDRVLPDHGPDHRNRPAQHRDRARLVHAADPVPQHPDGVARSARRGQGSGRGNGPHPKADPSARGAAACGAGDHGGPARRDRHDDLARNGRRLHHAARARRADLQRDPERREHRVRRGKHAGDRPRAVRRHVHRAGAAVREPVGAGAEGLVMSDLLNFFADNTQLLLEKTLAHLGISAIAMVVALALAMPLGVYLGHRHAGSFLAINISNVFRALPSLALIAISLAFFGLSRLNVEIALVALAVPPILTNAYTAVDGVDPDAVEAARGMGMTERQVLTGIELPLSWPLIFAGIRTAAVYVVATAPLAAIAGGGGLGDIILNQPTYGLVGVIAATIVVVVLAFAVDILFALVQRAVTPRGLHMPAELVTIVPAGTDTAVVAKDAAATAEHV